MEDSPKSLDVAWPFKPKCSRRHTIYAVDRSGPMYGSSWTRAMDFLTSTNIMPQHKFLFSFWTWTTGAPIEDYYIIYNNPTLPPPMSSPSGGANFDDALHRASLILSQNFVASTCLILISDGWTPWAQAAVDDFNAAKKNFTSKTSC